MYYDFEADELDDLRFEVEDLTKTNKYLEHENTVLKQENERLNNLLANTEKGKLQHRINNYQCYIKDLENENQRLKNLLSGKEIINLLKKVNKLDAIENNLRASVIVLQKKLEYIEKGIAKVE